MVLGLATVFQDSQVPVGIEGCGCKDVEEVGGAHVVRARASHEDAARPEHLQGAQVQLFIAADGGLAILARFRERRGIENDGVVLSA
jgi:hypothetical protein